MCRQWDSVFWVKSSSNNVFNCSKCVSGTAVHVIQGERGGESEAGTWEDQVAECVFSTFHMENNCDY